APDQLGFEGETYIGETRFTTDGSGNASFNSTGPALTVGHSITATATAAEGTSEFSAAQPVNAAPTVQFSSATYPVGEGAGSILITVNRTGDLSALSTVQYTTSNGTATAPGDYTVTAGT